MNFLVIELADNVWVPSNRRTNTAPDQLKSRRRPLLIPPLSCLPAPQFADEMNFSWMYFTFSFKHPETFDILPCCFQIH